MSFDKNRFAAQPLRTREQIAREVHAVALGRQLDDLATVIALMTISTEVGAGGADGQRQWWCPANPGGDPPTMNYPHDSICDDENSSGYFQQRPPWWGTARQRMTLADSATMFLTALADDYTRAANDPDLAGWFAQQVQGSAYPLRYAQKWDEAWAVLRQALVSGQVMAVRPHTAPASAGTHPPAAKIAERVSSALRSGAHPGAALLADFASPAPNTGETRPSGLWVADAVDRMRPATGSGATGSYAAMPPAATGRRAGDPLWLEEVLTEALGPRLRALPGWRDCGHGDFQDIRGVMVHHTGNSAETAESIRRGSPPVLPGPVANLHIAPDGTVTIVAAGVTWHAGYGSHPWLPEDDANPHMIGIECAWPDWLSEPPYGPDLHQHWPDAQIISMRDTCAALALRLGIPAEHVIGHKEWAGRKQGKIDPGNMDMDWFRGEVAKAMRGEFATPAATPMGAAVPMNVGPISEPPTSVAPTHPEVDASSTAPANPRSDRQLLEEIWAALYGPEGYGWPQLGGKTIVDHLAELGAPDKTAKAAVRKNSAKPRAGRSGVNGT